MQHCLARVDAVAHTDAAVLILGESGVGKELVATRIHEQSRRTNGPLVTVNCAAIPRDLFESEFFGHVRGAFSGAARDRKGRFETADNGTLFLDEVGEIPPELQGKLLRALQHMTFERVGDDRTRRVNVRVASATNRSLFDEVTSGRFRRDLYYRLSTVPIEVPPLRERREDIGPLAQMFIEEISAQLGRKPPSLGPHHLRRLQSYEWPGNVRELRNVLERALILGENVERIELGSTLPPVAHKRTDNTGSREPAESPTKGYLTARELLDFEKNNLISALEAAHWRVSGAQGAAELLGMNPSTLASRLKVLKIARPSPTSLYLRIGGEFRIAAFCRDLMGRMQADPQTGRFWAQRSNIGIRREERLLVQYLCAVTGGPAVYAGRDMVQAHSNLDISSGDWIVFLRHLTASFEAMGFDADLRRDLCAHVDGLRSAIVHG